MFEITAPLLRRGRTPVLGAFSLALDPGEMLGVVGPNGSGKSTLLRAIAGLAPEKVAVLRQGRNLERREIGHLPQAFAVRSSISVLECILLGRREDLGLRVPGQMIGAAERMLQDLGLADLADRPMSALSGGQQQRVLISQRLFRAPALMLMDEPTSALDPISTSKIEELCMELKGKYTIVIVTHNMQQALRIADTTAFFLLGDMVEVGATDQLFSMPRDKRTEDYITGRFG